MKSLQVKLPLIALFVILFIAISTNIVNVFYQNASTEELLLMQMETHLLSSQRVLSSKISDSFGELSLEDGELTNEDGNNLLDDSQFINTFAHDSNLLVGIYIEENSDFSCVLNTTFDKNLDVSLGTITQNGSDAQRSILNGRDYYEMITVHQDPYYAFYSPIFDDENRVIGLYFLASPTSNLDYYMQNTTETTYYAMAIIILLISIITFLYFYYYAGSIVKPINELTKFFENLGHKEMDISHLKSTTETQKLIDVVSENYSQFYYDPACIEEISYNLDLLSQGNLNLKLQKNYNGQLKKVRQSLENLIYNLHTSILNIRNTSSKLSSNLDKVSQSSQVMSQGAIKHTNLAENVYTSIDDINLKITNTNKMLLTAKNQTEKVGTYIQDESKKIDRMISKLTEVNHDLLNTRDFVKLIREVSDKTSILAVNAAVEASRAGKFGIPFLNISDEIRGISKQFLSLSQKYEKNLQCTELATTETHDMVESIDFMSSVKKMLADIEEIIDDISKTTYQQTSIFSQINRNVTRMTQILKQTSDSAQENAASTIELSQISDSLLAQVTIFKLKSSNF